MLPVFCQTGLTDYAALTGIEAIPLEVEVHASGRGEQEIVSIVGLPEAAVKESRERVMKARAIQQARFKGTKITCNGRMEPAHLLKYCKLDPPTETLIRHAIEEFGLSARAYDRILRVSRTIADLAGSAAIRREHLFEAIGYRSMDRRN